MLLNQMEVDRKLRDDLRWDSLKLSIKFSKLLYGKSQAHKAFIPKRFEDLRLNGGIRFRRISIKLAYHKARLKKRKRWLVRENGDPSVTQKPEISTSSLRLGVKSVGMKKQYHQKKRTAEVKLAQACKSLGMFLDSPSFRDPQDCTKICVVKRQIFNTGVKPETHLFPYGFIFPDPMDIDGHVHTWIGDQCIFSEEVEALEHDGPDAAMESWQDETSMVSDLTETAKYKTRVETSHVRQQKWKRGFHKVRFKDRRHLRKSLCTGRFVLQKKLSVWSHHETRKKEMIGLNIPDQPLRQLEHKGSDGKVDSGKLMEPGYDKEEKRSCIVFHSNHVWKPGRIFFKLPEPLRSLIGDSIKQMKLIRCSVSHILNGVKCCEELIHVSEFGVWDPGVTGLDKSHIEGLRRWKKILKVIKLHMRHGVKSFSFSMCVKKQTLRPVKMFCGRQLYESYLANQVWKPGGDGDDSSLCLSMLFGNCKEVSDNDGGKETDLERWLNCFEELDPSRVLYVWDPGQAKAANKLLELLKSPHSEKNLVNGVEAETLEQEHDSGGSFSGLVFEVCVVDTGWKRGVGALEMLTLDPGELAGLRNKSDIKFSLRNAKTMWNGEGSCERVTVSIMNEKDQHKLLLGRLEFDILVKCCVLGATRLLGSQQTISSWEVEITDSSVGLWTLEDNKAVILPGTTLKFYGGKIMKLFLSAEKKIIEEAADCQEVNSQDLENVLMTFIRTSHSPSSGDPNLMRESTQDSQAVLTQYNWSCCWILVVHNVLLCLCVSALCSHMNLTGQELEEDNKTQGPVTLRHVSGAHDIYSNIQWHSICGDLNYQDSLSKEGLVSYVYSSSGISDALLNHKMDTPTSENLQGTEKKMGFYFYDWFQSPRPPELSKTGNLVSLLYISSLVTGLIENHGNGALVITASKVRRLEDKLAPVLHQLEDKLVSTGGVLISPSMGHGYT